MTPLRRNIFFFEWWGRIFFSACTGKEYFIHSSWLTLIWRGSWAILIMAFQIINSSFQDIMGNITLGFYTISVHRNCLNLLKFNGDFTVQGTKNDFKISLSLSYVGKQKMVHTFSTANNNKNVNLHQYWKTTYHSRGVLVHIKHISLPQSRRLLLPQENWPS